MQWGTKYEPKDLVYALFPFQGEKPDEAVVGCPPKKEPATYFPKGWFVLQVRFPEDRRADVETAMWAWVNFGGLGARTRRGCGSLYCEDLAPKDVKQLSEWFKVGGATGGAVREWPTMPAGFYTDSKAVEPMKVWDHLIGRMRYFRQGETFARNPGPGRSLYPEPDTIRRITGIWSARHTPGNWPDGFPRAEFGLPIIFHFNDKTEPGDMTLNPYENNETKDRMASPLLLKPLAVSATTAIPIVLRLITTPLTQVELQDKARTCLTPKHAVPVSGSPFTYPGSPLTGRSPNGSAVEAFLAYLTRDHGFTEVK